MTQEDKHLLLQDLCARLPYGVKALINGWEGIIKIHDISDFNEGIKTIKPYLRPMSSMTEEEKKEYIKYAGYEIEESVNGRHYEYYLKDFCGTPSDPLVNTNAVDWLNKKMFDYRGLVPMELALEAPKDMYKH